MIRQAELLPAGLDKIVCQAGGHVHWFEMTEPTLQNVRDGIDSVLEHGHGYRAPVGAMKQGTGLLHEDPEQPLPLAEMIPISTDVHIRTWWAMSMQSEPMDMLFYGHRTQGEDCYGGSNILKTSEYTRPVRLGVWRTRLGRQGSKSQDKR